MEWYSKLSIHQKINAKECFKLLTGVSFSDLSCIFNIKERMDIMEMKLIQEGIIKEV